MPRSPRPAAGLPLMAAIVAMSAPAHGQLSQWTDIASSEIAGADHEHHRGAAWGDVNNDGLLDLYVTHWGVVESPFPGSPNQLFLNVDGTSFVESTPGPIDLPGSLSHHPIWGDIDNDGRLDLYVTQSSNAGADISRLFHHQPDGTFVEITGGNPVSMANTLPRNATWADYDHDGLLDLYVCNSGGDNEINRLMRNQGDGTFVQMSVGLDDQFKHSRSAAWCDFDNDGLQDVYVTSGGELNLPQALRTNALYRNNGDGTFTNVAADRFVANTAAGRGCAWGDYTNDGRMDLFVANIPTAETAGHNALYRCNGDYTFTLTTVPAGLFENRKTRCVSWIDYDNDGWLDLYVVNFGGSSPPNQLFRNNADGTFTDVAAGTPIAAEPNGNAGVWADFNNDGWIDLFSVGGSDSAPGVGQNRLCRNDNQNGNHWVQFDLVGTISNRSAIGARVTLQAGGMTQVREVQSGSGYNAQHMLRVHFGLGLATTIDSVEIRWPSGYTQTLSGVTIDQIHEIEESCEVGVVCNDCNMNGVGDPLDLLGGTSADCNANEVPDECDIAGGAPDVDANGVIDTCEDCNDNGVPDGLDIADQTSDDCDLNGLPDECDEDCDGDMVPDTCQIAADPGLDANNDGVLDSCGDGDLNGDGAVNVQDLVVVILGWGPCPGGGDPCLADTDGDGQVGVTDLLFVILNWG